VRAPNFLIHLATRLGRVADIRISLKEDKGVPLKDYLKTHYE
jgi:hypothetical protein